MGPSMSSRSAVESGENETEAIRHRPTHLQRTSAQIQNVGVYSWPSGQRERDRHGTGECRADRRSVRPCGMGASMGTFYAV